LDIAAYIIVFTVGLLFGSFTNVIIARMPVGESIVSPPSHCPHCNEQLRAVDLVPVFSYLFLRGRCRYCRGIISIRYPLVEILCALLFIGVYLRWGLTMTTVAGCIFSVILLAAAFIDIDHGIIPDRLTYPGMVMGLVLSFWTLGFLPALWGFLAFGGLMFAVAFISNGGMGGGDVKLAAVIGAFTGITGSAVTLLMASLSGAIFGLGVMAVKKTGRKTPIKFGPFLAVSAYIAFLFANAIASWYLGFL
jgi:leader peptidase (prepilin peptidase)/N-methyltransferase